MGTASPALPKQIAVVSADARSAAEDPIVVPTEPTPPKSLRMRFRFWRVFLYAVLLFARIIFWQLVVANFFPDYVERTSLKRWQRYAHSFRLFAIKTGGVMIKAGQFLSTREDVFPKEVIDELSALRDEVPAVPFDKMKPIIDAEIGPIDGRFSQFDDHPVAAASIGQVYRARLKDGERVVVKVQRPGIVDICHTDLAALIAAGRFANHFGFVRRRADAESLAREFGRVLLEELSYRHEAKNARRFAEMFKNDLGVYIPAVYPEHSTDRVLTMEDVTTIKINDYAALEAAGISRKVVAKRLMDTYLRQIFEERFFHADPHPGNLFVYPLPHENGATSYKGDRPFYLIFIDFGMTGSLTPQIAEGLIDTLAAVINRDAAGMIQNYKRLGFLLPEADTARIEEATRAVFDQVWGLSMAEMSNLSYSAAADLGNEFNDLIFAMPFQVPQDFVYLGRTVGILNGMCTAIDPDFNPWSELQPYATRMATQALSQTGPGALIPVGTAVVSAILGEEAGRTLTQFGQQVGRALTPPMTAQDLIGKIERGEIHFHTEPSASHKRQLARIEAQTKRTGRVVFVGSLLITSTLFYTHGDVAIAAIGYVVTAVTFLNAMFRE
ncbi:MAG: AarF/ABC1/UbiB kinase family protein [Anaerolineae bacterium]|nr:AarF/ABC1/UbiB kinase family protein [Anaerolineae bacterium]